MSRYKAALIHLAISAAIGVATVACMLAIWYPGALFAAAGGGGLVLILLAVDVTIGPLITLVVFDTKKKSLRMDLTVVALLQIGAFMYGASIIFQARPVYVAFVVDRFELVRAAEIDPDDLKSAKTEQFRTLPVLRPRLIGVQLPAGSGEQGKALALALAGKDVQVRPEFYVPYDAQRELVKRKLYPMQRLKDLNPGASAEIDDAIRATGRKPDDLGFLPLKARSRDLAVVIDKASGSIIDYWKYRPWEA